MPPGTTMVAPVERMLALHKKLAATISADKEFYQQQIEATDRQIDALVYELYGLTEEETAVVGGEQKQNGPLSRGPFTFGLSFQAAAREAIRAAARVASCFFIGPVVLPVPPAVV